MMSGQYALTTICFTPIPILYELPKDHVERMASLAQRMLSEILDACVSNFIANYEQDVEETSW